METTTQRLLDAAKAATGAATDYRLAKVMNWTTQTVSNYQNGKTQLDNRALLQIAAVLKMDAAEVVRHMAEIEQERARTDDARAQWSELLKVWGGRAAMILITCALIGIAPNRADAAMHNAPSYCAAQSATPYCFQKCMRQYWRQILRFVFLFASFFSSSKRRNIPHCT